MPDCFKHLSWRFRTPSLSYPILVTGSLILSAFPSHAAEKICAIYPHLKDSYWLSVNYGMVEESKNQGVNLKVLESGGYPNLTRQTQQIEECRNWGADAIVLGTVAPDAYKHTLADLVRQTPVFVTVNQLNTDSNASKSVHGYVGVDWYDMGFKTGNYLKKKHPKGSGKVQIAWLPGPEQRGGTKPVERGFHDAIKSSDVEVVVSLWEDNDKELQRNLVQQVLESEQVDYIVGSAVAIEAAISELRNAKRTDIGLISTYLSHGIYRGLRRDRVQFAPTDKMVQQGRISIQQATHYLRNEPFKSNFVPVIEPLTPEQISKTVIADSLSPAEYRPIYMVEEENHL
ncbi:periplasmic sensory protein associated with the TorRS two-component regulatory system [Vibrio nigripulchritudo SFn27]|uniref:Periplasmic sensory protein associated with the TorRS two-component regulatory system n=1 Tax=Vibrio nigripulchritudo TaxID=28173 RepID=U4K6Q9_9VIBR|nr:TMAO reductase system periplasmic protein TorT [Vibrio nigripulchritudo]CCN81613.1 periplasmic sensory protein associated with the TorRS two-component regulatory system [Vibrio nigripulchritudo BLFn1]CCN91710.1 periplasmic sensory protein associated with the TorRS two-component regulatory system [Vibrio nigripulchritudo SFn27]CCN96594.1 periplasmic sensory protein associated with the TorRS two-component regulatory system [Vibrio nigripulchritudo ENn2]CCO38468.1 periplasmic sensory protein as